MSIEVILYAEIGILASAVLLLIGLTIYTFFKEDRDETQRSH